MNPSSPASPRLGRPVALALAATALVAIGAIALMVWLGSLKPESSSTAGPSALLQVTAAVAPGAAVKLSLPGGEATVFIPADAVTGEGSVALALREPDLFPESGEQAAWRRPVIVNLEFYDRAGNLVIQPAFANPIVVCFALGGAEWERYMEDPAAHRIQYYDDQSGPPAWVSLPTRIDTENRQLCGDISHLTLIALALQEAPVPVPTSQGPYAP